MNIWIDADACPVGIKEIIFRSAKRNNLKVTMVANSPMYVPYGDNFSLVQVKSGSDVADNHIAENCQPGDLVITADVPLAARVVEKGASGLNPRGELYTEENVKECLAMRNFMEELRFGGLVTGGPSSHSANDNQRFANSFDKFLMQWKRGTEKSDSQT